MSRSTDNVDITTKAARMRLAGRQEPHWRGIEGGLAIGYRKGERGGTWVARLWDGARYRKMTLGRADDAVKATLSESEVARGDAIIKVLDFRHAQAGAQEWARRNHRVAAGLEPEVPARLAVPYTVTKAVADYLLDYGARGGKALSATRTAAKAHILPALGAIPVSMLTRAKLKAWHRALAASPARLRSKPGEVRYRDPEDDPDISRRRRSSANRILTILKAVLNHAHSEGKVTCGPDAWSVVKPLAG